MLAAPGKYAMLRVAAKLRHVDDQVVVLLREIVEQDYHSQLHQICMMYGNSSHEKQPDPLRALAVLRTAARVAVPGMSHDVCCRSHIYLVQLT